ncbi:MAG: hypothetical protein K6C69_07675 [Lachnospiraceae bacterium]|nr:hypothetical protein [Lachnospiraceae bacterium]
MKRKLSANVLHMKHMAILGCTVLMVSLVGCDATNSASVTESTPSKQEETVDPSMEEVKDTARLYDYFTPIYVMMDQNTEAGLGMQDGHDLAVTDIVSLEENPEGIYAGCYHHNIFYYTYDYENMESDYPQSFIKIWMWNVSTGERRQLTSLPNLSQIVVEHGVLYLHYQDMSDGTLKAEVYDALTGEAVEADRHLLDGLNSLEAYEYSLSYGAWDHCILADTVNYGFIPIRDSEGNNYLYDGTNITPMEGAIQTGNLVDFTQDYFIFYTASNKENDWTYDEIQVLSRKDGGITMISQNFSNYLGCTDQGLLYWSEPATGEGNGEYEVYQYDLNTQKKDLLIHGKELLGVGITQGISGFTLISEQAFALVFNSETNDVEWARLYVDPDGNPQQESLGVSVKHVAYMDYGTSQVISDVVTCPYCGKIIARYDAQVYQLDEGISMNSQELNAQFLEEAKTACENFKTYEVYYPSSLEECQNTLHGEIPGIISFQEEVSHAGFIQEHFFTVDYDGYWFGGGAHGMPSRKHILINTDTGTILSFQDLYSGTEADLKTLVYDAVKADYEKKRLEQGDYFQYFAQDGDEAATQALDYVSLNALPCRYEDTGIVIEFEPYLLGSFVAGYIEIFISYEDLGIDLSQQ